MTQVLHDILDARTKDLSGPGVCYKLGGTSLMYGMDVADMSDQPPNEQEMSFVLPFANGQRRDGVGDLLEVGGIDLERHQKNAINLFDHGKHVALPIGMSWERDETGKYDPSRYTVQLDPNNQTAITKCFVWQGCDDGLIASSTPGLKDHAVCCEQYFHMIVKRMLGCGSIGYQIIDGQEIPPDFQRGVPKGVHLRRVRMLEASLVVLPANMDTVPKHKALEWVREVLAMPRMCGKPLSPVLVKSLTPHLPEQTTTVVGFADVVETKPLEEIEAKAKEAALKSQLPHVREGMHVCSECSKRFYARESAKACHGKEPYALRGKSSKSMEPDPELAKDMVSKIQKVCETFSSLEGLGPDYQNCFWNESEKHVWWEGFDGDGDNIKEVERRLRAIPGVEKVTIEAEANPWGDDGWLFIWRNGEKIRKEWKSGKSVPVPHGDLSESNIPPAKWKPGVGTVKKVPDPANINEFQPGQTVTARKIMTWTDKTTGRVDTFARTGDRLEVVSVTGDGALATVRRPDGKTVQVTGASIRRSKGMPESKSLDEIRKHWKQMRLARARKHAPKSFKFLVTCKHEGKSGQFEVVATSMKDAAEIAKKCSKDKCGMPPSSIKAVKQAGQIKMKSLETKGKAMDDEVELDDASPETPEQQDDDWSGEPFGSQVLRRLHQDKSHLMKEYDGFMGLLDHEPTKGHLGSHMEYMEKFLGDTEKLHGKHYKHLPGIGGKALTEDEAGDIADELETQTEDTEEEPVEDDAPEIEEVDAGTSADDTVEADSGGDSGDEVSGEEALEGMEKDRKGKSLKSNKKAHPCERGERADYGECTPKGGKKKKSMCPDCGKEGCSCNKKAMGSQGGNQWGLQDHEMKNVGEANDFMGELSSTQDFSDEHRMKSYHYHKTLDGIGQMEDVNQDLNQDDVAMKSDPGSDQWQQEEMEEPQHQGSPMSKMCKDMSGWYKQLSQTRDFGDPHRKRCGEMHKAMADMMNGAGTEEEAPVEGEETEEVIPDDMGAMDEKALLNYEKAVTERGKQIAALAKQIAAIRL